MKRIQHTLCQDPEADPEVVDLIGTAKPFAVGHGNATVLLRFIREHGCRRVLEFGAGASSWVIAHALQSVGGGELVSVEQDPGWCREIWAKVRSYPCVQSNMLQASYRFAYTRTGPQYLLDAKTTQQIQDSGPYDLIFIDAPQGYFGRDGTLHAAMPAMAKGALVVLDDASRWKERRIVQRWLKQYPSLTQVHFDSQRDQGKGVAVLQCQKAMRPRAYWPGHIDAGWLQLRNMLWRWKQAAAARSAAVTFSP